MTGGKKLHISVNRNVIYKKKSEKPSENYAFRKVPESSAYSPRWPLCVGTSRGITRESKSSGRSWILRDVYSYRYRKPLEGEEVHMEFVRF